MAETMDTPPAEENPVQTFTPATRITELNAVDTSITTLLTSAATTVGILSNSPSCAPNPPPTTLEEAQSQLTDAVETFFSTLSTIEVRLRRNIYALEEAGLVETGDEKDARKRRALGTEMARVGGGPLDPSWLNARADNGVEAALKKELLRDVKAFLAEAKTKENGAG